ncbi:sigma-70 family RNA polymerase sigma factor [Luteolibacter flavescens]|uniref:Sigma-70 family RNA polymerase sigma factor n=1 Tax=Luteolibacter flavescens TaxID=1859460 RepID=A0ABT3FWN8_9BACT|nr:sigma-70 family RNA polymerase sigma factor [Luteolibacter flavescens]MCW1887410.1 sigma-70 family RNA polymerase sigma factor [Luteolibacter flavescens]
MSVFRAFSRSIDSARCDADFRRYVSDGNADAFRRLVERHLPLVQETAARVLGGRAGWIDDVSQDVFLMLARKARQLPPEIVLSAWLHRQSVRRALDVVRSETRRRKREEIADLVPDESPGVDQWSAIAPQLDREMLRLPEQDRQVLILRFMERLTSEEIARRLGLSSAAVRKRVERALAKLRERLVVPLPGAGAGALTVTALAAYLSVPTAKAATASQVTAICSGSLAATAAAPTISLTVLTLMTKSQLCTAGAVVAIGAGAYFAGLGNGSATPREGTDARNDAAHTAAVANDSRASSRQAATSVSLPASKEGKLEMLRKILADPDAVSRSQSLDRFISRLAPEDFGDIASFLTSYPPATDLEREAITSATHLVISAWAQKDPIAALAFFEKSPNLSLVQLIGSIWGARDPEAAIAWARARPAGSVRADRVDPFMSGLISSLASQDIARAKALFAEMPVGVPSRSALPNLIPHLIAEGKEGMQAWLDGLQDDGFRKEATNLIANEIASDDPRAATEWLIERTGGVVDFSDMSVIFTKWMSKDREEALAYYDAQPAGEMRDQTFTAISFQLSGENMSDETIDWMTGRITNQYLPVVHMDKLFARWGEKDPAAAIAYLESQNSAIAAHVSTPFLQGLFNSSPASAAEYLQEHPDRVSPTAVTDVVKRLIVVDPGFVVPYLEGDNITGKSHAAAMVAWLQTKPEDAKAYLDANFETMPEESRKLLYAEDSVNAAIEGKITPRQLDGR